MQENRKFLLLSLCGNAARELSADELRALPDYTIGYCQDSVIESVLDDDFDDYTELVFSVDESIPVPANKSGGDIYQVIASWAVNVAFGRMDNLDTLLTLESIAADLDKFNKGDEFRRAADLDYYHAQFAGLDYSDFDPVELPACDTDEQREQLEQEYFDYNIDDFIRELRPPFGTLSRDKVKSMLFDFLSGEQNPGCTWYKK